MNELSGTGWNTILSHGAGYLPSLYLMNFNYSWVRVNPDTSIPADNTEMTINLEYNEDNVNLDSFFKWNLPVGNYYIFKIQFAEQPNPTTSPVTLQPVVQMYSGPSTTKTKPGLQGSYATGNYYNITNNFPDILTNIEGDVYIVYHDTAGTCFLEGTPVETNQGLIEIEKVETTNTINGNPVIAVTKTYGKEGCLVLIKKDHISENVPSQDTIVSIWHKILYNNAMVKAKDIPGVTLYPYSGQALYNVLMKTHQTMRVNNMTVETLLPEHEVAKQL